MDDDRIRYLAVCTNDRDRLCFYSDATLPRRSPPDNVADHVELALTFGRERKPFGCICEQRGSNFRQWSWAPVMRLFGAADDGASFERTRDTKGP
jgi:hypothetical protein